MVAAVWVATQNRPGPATGHDPRSEHQRLSDCL